MEEVESSHIPDIEKITKELIQDIEIPDLKHSMLYKCMVEYFDTIKSSVAMIREDKKVLYLNEYGKALLLRNSNITLSDFVGGYCIGHEGECPLKDKCNSEDIWKNIDNKKIYIYKNIKSPISISEPMIFDVAIMPIFVNGTKAIIEMWTEVIDND